MITDTKLIADWKENTSGGHALLYSYLKEQGKVVMPNAYQKWTLSTDEQMTRDRLNERVTTGSWACMFAADQAEFDAQWESMKADCEGMGINEYVASYVENYNAGVEAMAPYIKD